MRKDGELGGLVWKGGTLWDKILPGLFLFLNGPAGFRALGNKEASPMSLGPSGPPSTPALESVGTRQLGPSSRARFLPGLRGLAEGGGSRRD